MGFPIYSIELSLHQRIHSILLFPNLFNLLNFAWRNADNLSLEIIKLPFCTENTFIHHCKYIYRLIVLKKITRMYC